MYVSKFQTKSENPISKVLKMIKINNKKKNNLILLV